MLKHHQEQSQHFSKIEKYMHKAASLLLISNNDQKVEMAINNT